MIPRDVANDELLDYTHTLEFLCHHLLAPGCSVILSPRQFEVLKAYLQHIDTLVPDANFALEQCIDHRPSGYSVAWDNDGDDWQDDFIDTVMERMTQSLGFYAGAIIREGYLIELDEISQQIEEIKGRVLDRSRQRALDSIETFTEDPTFKSHPPRSPDQKYSDLTDRNRRLCPIGLAVF